MGGRIKGGRGPERPFAKIFFDHLGLGGLRVAGKIMINSNENMLGTYYATKYTYYATKYTYYATQLCYKMYKSLRGMKHHTQSQSTFTFCLIKPYQPFNQTIILYLRDIHIIQSDHIFTRLYIYSHISHSCEGVTKRASSGPWSLCNDKTCSEWTLVTM